MIKEYLEYMKHIIQSLRRIFVGCTEKKETDFKLSLETRIQLYMYIYTPRPRSFLPWHGNLYELCLLVARIWVRHEGDECARSANGGQNETRGDAYA